MRPRRRCSCDRQRVPRRRARVGGLCGFPDTAERVPAKHQKTGRCADVRECPAELQHRSRSACGRLSAEGEAASGEAGQSRGVVRAPWRSHLPAVRTVRGFRRGVATGTKIALMGSERKNSPVGVGCADSPAVSRETAGLHTEIGGKTAWQATRSSSRSG